MWHRGDGAALPDACGEITLRRSGDSKRVVVLGASNKRGRYSNQAVRLLKEKGYSVVPVHPKLEQIEGLPVSHSLEDIKGGIDTLTVYVGPNLIAPLIDDIVQARPKRVILNPGTESDVLEKKLSQNNIFFIKACTLVLLRTGQFEERKGAV